MSSQLADVARAATKLERRGYDCCEIWSCRRDGTKLRFEGDFYAHKLMTPMFTPES